MRALKSESPTVTPPGERRTAQRSSVHLVAEIEVDGSYVGCGVSRDASPTGLLLLTRADLHPGGSVMIRLLVPGEDGPRVLRASVVRRERMMPGESPIWTKKIAVSFDDPPPDLEQIVEALTKRDTSANQPE